MIVTTLLTLCGCPFRQLFLLPQKKIMNFTFIPFKLNMDIADFEDDIQYLTTDNGIDLYKAKEELKKPILGLSPALQQ